MGLRCDEMKTLTWAGLPTSQYSENFPERLTRAFFAQPEVTSRRSTTATSEMAIPIRADLALRTVDLHDDGSESATADTCSSPSASS